MNWLMRLLRRDRLESELDRELSDHIEQRIADLIHDGLNPTEAARQTRLEFGTADEIKEACRDARGTRWFEDFSNDCRYGFRILLRSPVFTAVAVLSLALGIGANTAIFTLMDRLMFRNLTVKEPEQLVEIGPCCLSYPDFEAIQQNISGLTGVLAEFPLGPLDIFVDGTQEQADIEFVSDNYYSVLGVQAAVGRMFSSDSKQPAGNDAVAVISNRYWKRRFGSDPAVIGKTFRRVDTLFTIIGVAPPEFTGTRVGADPDIAVPLIMDAQVRGGKSWRQDSGFWWLALLGRLRPGVGSQAIQSELNAKLGKNSELSPLNRNMNFRWKVLPAATGLEGRRSSYREPLRILMGAVLLVLLLACANLANLLLSKGAARLREIGIRVAIGAARGRIVRQLLTESLIVSACGAALGVTLAYAFAEYLLTFVSNGGPRLLLDVTPDARVLAFVLFISITACVLFGGAPAILLTRSAPQPLATAPRRWRIGRALLATQMAISVILLIVAGIFVRTLGNIYHLDSGLNPKDVILFSSNLTNLGYAGLGYSNGRAQREQGLILSQLNTLPELQSVTITKHVPISRGSWRMALLVAGHQPAAEPPPPPYLNSVGPDFFKTFGTPLLMGREFDARDTDDSPRVAIVNESFARHYFASNLALGKWLAFPCEKDTQYEVVGVVKDVRYESLREDPPETVYFSATQVPPGDSVVFALRTHTLLGGIAPAIQKVFTTVDPMLRLQDMQTLDDHLARSLFQERLLAILAGFFAALAVVLGAIGIYGVMAYNVSQRRKEIGIRIALGAGRGDVLRLVLGQTAAVSLAGCLIGTAASFQITRVAKGIIYGVQPNDPTTIAVAITTLVSVAMAAAYLPGRRAARTNPVETLRTD